MLKYPSIEATKGKGAQVLISSSKSERIWWKMKTSALAALHGTQTLQEHHHVLNWKEFLYIAFLWETPLFHMMLYIDLIIQFGGMVTFLSYFVFAMAASVPLLTVQLFLGSYTKRGSIKLWEMVPVLKGMIWSVSVFSICLEFFNMSASALALTYIPDLFHPEVPWSQCNFLGASKNCSPMYPKQPYTNCTSEQIRFPAYEYLLNYKIQAQDPYKRSEGIGTLQVPWAIALCFTWFLIFLFLSAGLPQFRTIICISVFIFGAMFLIPTLGLMFFLSGSFAIPAVMRSKFKSVFRQDFWLSILTHSFSRKIPSNYIMLGSFAPHNMIPNLQIFCLYAIKFICLLCLMVWLSTSLYLMQQYYKVEDVMCIPISGMVLVFAVVPDILIRIPMPQIPLALYFVGLWFYGFATTLYTMTAFLESLIEALPAISRVKVYFCAILCSFCCVLNMLLLTNLHFAILEMWNKVGLMFLTITLTFIFSIGIYIYSVGRYADDFYFTYGQPIIGTYWTHSLKLMSLTLCFALILCLFNMDREMNNHVNMVIKVLSYCAMAVVLMPVPIVAIWIYFKYKNQKFGSATTPTSYWGPPSAAKKVARSRFNPQREIRYKKENQSCGHNCLLNSQKVKNEIRMLQINRWRLTDSLRIEHSEEQI